MAVLGDTTVTKLTSLGPITGNLTGNASTATTATKLGTATVGGTAKPIYLNSGTPTAFSTNIGGTAQPVYMASGEIKPLSATVGSTTVPVYLNGGVITHCSTSLGVSITGTAAKATADGNGKTIATTYAPLASPALTGTPTAPTANASTNTTQIATTAFVQSAINTKIAASDAMIYKGTIGSTGATITALPATHSVGWTYKVITAGTYAGKVCEIGDMIICLTSGTAANNDHWTVVQTNVDGAVTGPASAVDARVAVFNGTTGKVIKDSGYTIAASVPSGAKFTDTTYTAGTGISLSGTAFSNSGVRSITAGSAANLLSVNTGGTTTTITINNVANATNASKATQLATARTIDGVSFNGTANIVHYGSCSTAAATVAKVVDCTGFTLATGARIIVKFTVTNTAANPTLNVNSTGAKAIYYRGAAISAGYLAANRTYQFVYNGTQYELVGDLDTNTNDRVTQTLTTTNAEYSILGMADAAATANKTNTTRFSTGITMNPSTNTITASVLKGSLNCSYLTGTIDGGELT